MAPTVLLVDGHEGFRAQARTLLVAAGFDGSIFKAELSGVTIAALIGSGS